MFRSLFFRRDTARSSAVDASDPTVPTTSSMHRADTGRRIGFSIAAILASAVLAIPLRAVLFEAAADPAPEMHQVQDMMLHHVHEPSPPAATQAQSSEPAADENEQAPATAEFTAAAAAGKIFMTLPDPYASEAVSLPFFDMTISGSAIEEAAVDETPPTVVVEESVSEPIAPTSEVADATGAIEASVRIEEVREEAMVSVPTTSAEPAHSTSQDAPKSTPIDRSDARSDGVDVSRLLSRARSLIEKGDISGARLILERAVNSGDRRAAFYLAETYDPRILATWKALGIKGDVNQARTLYIFASEGGVLGSRERLIDLR